MNDKNYIRTQDQEKLKAAHKAWNESERILKILRTETGKPLIEVTNEEIIQWHQKNNHAFP